MTDGDLSTLPLIGNHSRVTWNAFRLSDKGSAASWDALWGRSWLGEGRETLCPTPHDVMLRILFIVVYHYCYYYHPVLRVQAHRMGALLFYIIFIRPPHTLGHGGGGGGGRKK